MKHLFGKFADLSEAKLKKKRVSVGHVIGKKIIDYNFKSRMTTTKQHHIGEKAIQETSQ